jgi:hypothetical protein
MSSKWGMQAEELPPYFTMGGKEVKEASDLVAPIFDYNFKHWLEFYSQKKTQNK